MFYYIAHCLCFLFNYILFCLIFLCSIFWSCYFPSSNSSQSISTPRHTRTGGKGGVSFLQWSNTGSINHPPSISGLSLHVTTIYYDNSTIPLYMDIPHCVYLFINWLTFELSTPTGCYRQAFYNVCTLSLKDPREILSAIMLLIKWWLLESVQFKSLIQSRVFTCSSISFLTLLRIGPAGFHLPDSQHNRPPRGIHFLVRRRQTGTKPSSSFQSDGCSQDFPLGVTVATFLSSLASSTYPSIETLCPRCGNITR